MIDEDDFDFMPPPPKRVTVHKFSAWNPIETAPKDGRFVILFCPEDRSFWWASWQGGHSWFGSDEYGLRREGHSLGDPNVVTGWFVSHWMPLPTPPLSNGDRQ